MAIYHGTFSCGHKGDINIFGPTKDRQGKADWRFSGQCPTCFEKGKQVEREEYYAYSLKNAEEMNLVELIGTEGQIKWAITLRQKIIDKFISFTETLKNNENKNEALGMLDYIIKGQAKAAFYIDNKDADTIDFIKMFGKEYTKHLENPLFTAVSIEVDKKDIGNIKEATTVYPTEQRHVVPVEIKIKGDTIHAYVPKNEEFRALVKELGYTWGDGWERKIISRNGTVEDRASELANKLLSAGFAVTIQDEDIRKKAIDASFEPEHFNWITIFTAGNFNGCLCICWKGRDDTLYMRARSLPSAKWTNPYIAVKIEAFREVLEFATLYDFKISKSAAKAIEEHEASLQNISRVTPAVASGIVKKDGLKSILESSDDILDDLKD